MHFLTATFGASKSVGLWFHADSTDLKQMFSIKKYEALQTK